MTVLSILIQLVAAVLALRLMRVSERWRRLGLAWMVVFFVISLNVIFGAICFFDCVSLDGFPSSLPSAPYVTPEISFFMILGVAGGFPVSKYFQRLEESRVANEGVLQNLCKVSPVGIFRTDPRGQCFYVNQRWSEITGLSLEQAKGDGWSKSLHPEDRDRVAGDWHEAVEQGLLFQSEYRFQHSNGKITWVLGQAEAEIDSSGKIYGQIGTITDISASKQAREDLKSSHQLLDAIRHAQQQYITQRDPKLVFDDLLNNVLQLTQSKFGFIGEVLQSPEGKDYLKVHATTNISKNKETRKLYGNYIDIGMELHNLETLFEDVVTTGKPVISNEPDKGPRSGGLSPENLPLDSFLGLPFSHGERTIGIVGIANRPTGYEEAMVEYLQPFVATCSNLITAYRNDETRRRTEDALKESEQRFKGLLDNATAVVYIKDFEGCYIQVNALFETMFHLDKREIIGKTDHEIFPEEIADAFHVNDRKVWARGEPIEFEEVVQLDDGLHTYISVKFPLQDSKGNTYAVCGISTDITERKMAEALIARRNKILELIATGCPLKETLDALTLSVEEQTNGLYCSLMLLDEPGKRLFNGSSPHLPKGYVKAIDGFAIGPRVGSCGTAAYSKKLIIVEDIASDPLWADYKKTPLSYGLKACWSAPILSSKGQCLGTFALYYNETRTPTEWELDLIKNSAHLASFAIERHRDETALKEANDLLERRVQERTAKLKGEEAYLQTILNNVMDALITVNPKGEIESFNAAAEKIFGYSAREIVGENVTTIIPESYRQKHALGFKKFVEEQGLAKKNRTDRSLCFWSDLELKGLRKDGSIFPLEISISDLIYQNQQSFICVLRDITERKRAEAVILGQNRTLELLVKGGTLNEVLDTLLRSMEGFLDGTSCSIMILDESGKHLQNLLAPSLADAYLKRVDGLCIGPNVGTSGSSAYLNKVIFSEDVATDPRFEEFRDLVLEQGFRATLSCPIRNGDGNVLGVFCMFFNKAKKPLPHEMQLIQSAANLAGVAIERKRAEGETKKSLDEKELLLKEIHHRTKNNMQIISSVLWLQSKDIQEEKYREMFRDCSNRILSMALLHEKVYESPDLLEIDLHAYLISLLEDLFISYGVTADRIGYRVETNGISLDLDSGIPCGLLIQELVSNSLKHAFPEERRGNIWLVLKPREDGQIELIAGDDGIGLPPDLDFRNTPSLGLQLVTTLAEKQLGGSIELGDSRGTVFNVLFWKGKL
jgi:PAS domain S-box-containing protein